MKTQPLTGFAILCYIMALCSVSALLSILQSLTL